MTELVLEGCVHTISVLMALLLSVQLLPRHMYSRLVCLLHSHITTLLQYLTISISSVSIFCSVVYITLSYLPFLPLFAPLLSDLVKKRSTLLSLASLHQQAGDVPAMVASYSSLIQTYSPGDQDLAALWLRLTDLLLGLNTLQQPAWDMVCTVYIANQNSKYLGYTAAFCENLVS